MRAARAAGRAAPPSTRPAGARRTRRTVVMGAVTARAAGVRRGRRRARPRTRSSSPPARCAAPTRSTAMGGAQAIAALALGTETIRAGRRDRRARATSTCRRPSASSSRRRRDRRLRRAERPARDRCPTGADAAAGRARPARAGGARRRTRSSSRSADDERCSTRSGAAAGAPRAGAVACSCDAADLEAALAFAEALAPEHLQLIGRRGRGARAARAPRRLPVRRRRERDRVRRLRRGLEPHAADRAAPRASPPGSTPRHFRRRMAEVRIRPTRPPRSRPRGAAIARAEGFAAHAESMEARSGESSAMSRTRRDQPQDRRDRRLA